MSTAQEAIQIVQRLQSELAVAEARQSDAEKELQGIISNLEAGYKTADIGALSQLLKCKREELDKLLAQAQKVLAATPDA